MLQSEMWLPDRPLNGKTPSLKTLENSGIEHTSCIVLHIFQLHNSGLSDWTASLTLFHSLSLDWMLHVWSGRWLVFVLPLARWPLGCHLLLHPCGLTFRPLSSVLCTALLLPLLECGSLNFSASFLSHSFFPWARRGGSAVTSGLQWLCKLSS